jgi:hypothetical protein
MKSSGFARAVLYFIPVMLVVLLSHVAFAGDKLSGTNIDKRTALWFKAPDAAVGKLIPNGWISDPVAGGPFKGANAAIVLIDSYVAADAKGQPMKPLQGFVLALPAKKPGVEIADNLMVVYGVSTEDQVPGVYGVYVAGKVAIERTSKFSSDAGMTVRENWQFSSKDGNALELSLQYKGGSATRGKIDGRTTSGARPDYYHSNSIDHVSEIARSVAIGVDRVETYAFRATGPMLSPIFNGAEQLLGIGSTPVFSRIISVPE